MRGSPSTEGTAAGAGPNVRALLKPYAPALVTIVLLTVAANGLNLLVPKIIARTIDTFVTTHELRGAFVAAYLAVAVGVFLCTYAQNAAQTYASERVARDLRTKLVAKLATQDLAYIQRATAATLLTNVTADVDAVKLFVSHGVGALLSSVFVVLGASVLLLTINWRLGLAVLAMLPVLWVAFKLILGRIRKLSIRSQQAIDTLNRVINESILGAALIRLLNSQQYECEKFLVANAEARDISLSMLRVFASLVPIIILTTNLATLTILTLGGHFVIADVMSLGEFAAFNGYLAILVFPIITIGLMSNVLARAAASHDRIERVLTAPSSGTRGTGGRVTADLRGDITLSHVVFKLGETVVLKDVSFSVKAGAKTAVIGPTAAGKTQLLFLLTGLLAPTSGRIEYDGRRIDEYDQATLRRQVGIVFQDATMFNLTLRENIAFGKPVRSEDLEKAIAAAELREFVNALPQGLETVVSERGASLSGGQKQRITLARALALNPRVLLLDDFTAHVDATTERRILANVRRSYPGLTLLVVTQKIAPVEDCDQIVLLMEGEVLASGTHQELLQACPEYVQIYDSQRSTRHYESIPA